ncbi:MAG: ATP-cone domain protein [Dehalococcoidia bacterium]|nr:ATP-cone domain protein [Dehalococcoidia bacterium]
MTSPKGDVLVLLGGSGVGKSTMARYCAILWPAKRYIDVGTVREVLRADYPELELSTYGVWRLAGDTPTPAHLIKGFEKYSGLLWPTLVRIMKRTATEQNNLVLEGAMMSPKLLSELEIEGLRVHTRMLHVADPPEHLARVKSSLKPGSTQEKRLVDSFPLIRALQDYLEEECTARGIPVIENKIFEETQKAILHSLPSTVD